MWPPAGVSDTFTTAEINDIEAKVSESVISLKQGGIRIGTIELEKGKELYNSLIHTGIFSNEYV